MNLRARLIVALGTFLFLTRMCLPVMAGSVFVTGHDSDWHGTFGGNTAGAINMVHTAISYARDGSSLPFLYIESKSAPIPGGNAATAPFLTSTFGYSAGSYVVAEASDLASLSDFRAALNNYSAIVVASDHGGMLTSAELGFLNAHSADVLDYINSGGGLVAFAESNATGNTGNTPKFGFLPFLVTSTSFQSVETANTVTAFGASLGLANSDVNGNFSHNYFSSTGGMTPVDLFNGDAATPLSLAFRGQIGAGGVAPEPATWAGAVIGLIALGVRRIQRAQV